MLDAPGLAANTHMNLVDWSSTDTLAVCLDNSIYLLRQSTFASKLCDLNGDTGTSVSWMQSGTHLAVGTRCGKVLVWDVENGTMCSESRHHQARVGAMAWNGNILSTGSRDQSIHHWDIRSQGNVTRKLDGHQHEVCCLKWSYDGQQLASGGKDNKLLIWNLQSQQPVMKLRDSQAAVKAVTWSPHQRGILASGGGKTDQGRADSCIRIWNTMNNSPVSCVDTGSQVCNLLWSKNVNEIVSTHGRPLNQIMFWKCPSMSKVTNLKGYHTCPVR